MIEEKASLVNRILANSSSRRGALGGGITALALVNRGLAGAQEATPGPDTASRAVIVQGFSHGTLFQTQGDSPELPPYTLILWDVAPAGSFFVERTAGVAGIVPTDLVLQAISVYAPATAALIARSEGASTDRGELVWGLELAIASAGSDPGAVTYLGSVHDDSRAAEVFGVELTAAPAAQDFGPGYLIVTSVPGLDLHKADVLLLTTG